MSLRERWEIAAEAELKATEVELLILAEWLADLATAPSDASPG